MEWLNQQDPRTFTDTPEVRAAFIDLNMRIKGANQWEAETFYEKETMYFKRVIHASWDPNKLENYLARCTVFSLYSCFMDMAAHGDVLSFNQDDKLCYIEKRNYKAGNKDGAEQWESRARLIISPYGELAKRIEAGQVAYADPVIVVYDGDLFEIGTDDRSNTVVIWKSKVPRTSKKIIGAWVKITRPNGSFATPYLLQEEIDRLAGYSKRGNRGYTNALYGSGENGTGIDEGFLKAKTLKHGLKIFPRIKIGGTNTGTDDMDLQQEEDSAGLEHLAGTVPRAPQSIPPPQITPQGTDPFAPGYKEPAAPVGNDWDEPTPANKKGITVNTDEEDTF